MTQLAIKRKSPTYGFSLGRGREEWNVCPTFQLFEGYLRNWFLSHLIWSADQEPPYLGCLGSQRTKESSAVYDSTTEFVKLQKETGTAHRDQR